jgi:hypothetical protein
VQSNYRKILANIACKVTDPMVSQI